MNINFIPAIDAAAIMENAISKTADFDGTTFDNGALFAPGGIGLPMAAAVNVTAFALGGTAGASTWTGVIEESSDGSTWTVCGPVVSFTATGMVAVPGIVSKRYNRLKLELAGATGTGTIGLTAYKVQQGFAQ